MSSILSSVSNPGASSKKYAFPGQVSRMREPPSVPPSDLNEEQKNAFNKAVIEGRSIFATGRAGSGKSYLVRRMKKYLSDMFGARCVFHTASTGVAAVNIGGTTLHKFAGIGLGQGTATTLLAKVSRNPEAMNNWQAARVLIVDEISMIKPDLLDKLEYIARNIRRAAGDERGTRKDRDGDAPWGGIQMIFVGDFAQMPPVYKKGEDSSDSEEEDGKEKEPKAIYAFQAESWVSSVGLDVIPLHTQMRQRDDPVLEALLDCIRFGRVADGTHEVLDSAGSELPELLEKGVKPTKLFAKRSQVAGVNERELAKIESMPFKMMARDEGDVKYRKMLENCPAPIELVYKEGAQVILLWNLDVKRGLVNGTTGVIVKVERVVMATAVVLDDDADTPLDADGNEERVVFLPRVRFFTLNGELDEIVNYARWEIRVGEVLKAARTQIPLDLAWALTIHKSMGMTIGALEVDVSSCFEVAQVYVALSRCKTIKRMKVTGFDTSLVRANPIVVEYYRGLMGTEEFEKSVAIQSVRKAQRITAERKNRKRRSKSEKSKDVISEIRDEATRMQRVEDAMRRTGGVTKTKAKKQIELEEKFTSKDGIRRHRRKSRSPKISRDRSKSRESRESGRKHKSKKRDKRSKRSRRERS